MNNIVYLAIPEESWEVMRRNLETDMQSVGLSTRDRRVLEKAYRAMRVVSNPALDETGPLRWHRWPETNPETGRTVLVTVRVNRLIHKTDAAVYEFDGEEFCNADEDSPNYGDPPAYPVIGWAYLPSPFSP